MNFELTPEAISFAVGVVTSVVFEVWPRAKAWFDKLTAGQKYIFMSAFGLGIVAIFFGLGCFSLFGLESIFTCDSLGIQAAIALWVGYFLGNQTMFGAINTVKKIRS